MRPGQPCQPGPASTSVWPVWPVSGSTSDSVAHFTQKYFQEYRFQIKPLVSCWIINSLWILPRGLCWQATRVWVNFASISLFQGNFDKITRPILQTRPTTEFCKRNVLSPWEGVTVRIMRDMRKCKKSRSGNETNWSQGDRSQRRNNLSSISCRFCLAFLIENLLIY